MSRKRSGGEMQIPKRPSTVPDDRSGVPRDIDIPAHTGLSIGRDVGSPGEPLSGPRPMTGPCAGMAEGSVWQSPGGATASMVVTFDETPRTILGTSERNPWERQPAAGYQPNLETEPVLWREILEPWQRYLEQRRRSASTREGYRRFVVGTFERIGKADLREIGWADLNAHGTTVGERCSPSTYNSWVYAVKSFYSFAVDKLDAPIRDMGRKLDPLDADTVQRSQEPHPPLTRDEFQAVL